MDNGKEYISANFKDLLNMKGIELERTALYISEQNGRAERNLRTIIESAKFMLYSKKLPLFLSVETVNIAVYILNHTHIHTSNSQSPEYTSYELWAENKYHSSI